MLKFQALEENTFYHSIRLSENHCNKSNLDVQVLFLNANTLKIQNQIGRGRIAT